MGNKWYYIAGFIIILIFSIIIILSIDKNQMNFKYSGNKNNKDGNFPIKRGDTGEKVKEIQKHINEVIELMSLTDQILPNDQLNKLRVDGIFGPKTEKAVEKYVDKTGVVTKEEYKNNII